MNISNTFSALACRCLILTIGIFGLCSCDNEREIEFELPPYERELVVECFLEPGQPYILTLQESVGYFEDFELPLVDSALVVISHGTESDTLNYVEIQPGIGIYIAFNFVPADYNTEFLLYVRDPQGREVTASTRLLEPIPIDTLIYQFGAGTGTDTLARLEMRFMDDPTTDDWYQFTAHRNSLDDGAFLELSLEDRFSGTSEFVLSTFFDYAVGDTAIATLYHMTEDYYNYLETVHAARDNNGNPFGQPGTIKSNVVGGIGIFSGLNYVRKEIVIE